MQATSRRTCCASTSSEIATTSAAVIDDLDDVIGRPTHERRSAIGIAPRACSKRYSAGSTSSVSSVDDTMPPMTTVASGRCTSRADAGVERHRHEAERCDERRHQHGPQPRQRAVADGVIERARRGRAVRG